jgi:hypothetical protein
MKLLSWDQQLGLASPLPYAANQSGKTKTPSKNETGLDASRHTQVSAEGAEKNFLLDILFHRMSAIACSIRGDVKNILLPPPEARLWFAASSPLSDRSDARV